MTGDRPERFALNVLADGDARIACCQRPPTQWLLSIDHPDARRVEISESVEFVGRPRIARYFAAGAWAISTRWPSARLAPLAATVSSPASPETTSTSPPACSPSTSGVRTSLPCLTTKQNAMASL